MCFTLGNQLQRLHVLSFNRPFSLILKNTFFYVRLRVRWCCKQNSGLPTCITDNPTFTVKLVGIIAALSNTYLPLPSKWRFDSWWARACQFYFHVRKSLSTDLCVCSCATGVCELQLLWEVHLLQLLGDASPGPRLQPVRCQRLTHQVKSHQLPRLPETTATLCPLPHEHGHTSF